MKRAGTPKLSWSALPNRVIVLFHAESGVSL